jgi:hypothetical protein
VAYHLAFYSAHPDLDATDSLPAAVAAIVCLCLCRGAQPAHAAWLPSAPPALPPCPQGCGASATTQTTGSDADAGADAPAPAPAPAPACGDAAPPCGLCAHCCSRRRHRRCLGVCALACLLDWHRCDAYRWNGTSRPERPVASSPAGPSSAAQCGIAQPSSAH